MLCCVDREAVLRFDTDELLIVWEVCVSCAGGG